MPSAWVVVGDSGSGSQWLAAPGVLEFAPNTTEFVVKGLVLLNYHYFALQRCGALNLTGKAENLVCGCMGVALGRGGL